MDVSLENTSTLGRRVKVSVPDAEISEQIKTKMAKLAKEVRLKGFRPGKVPAHVLNEKFGKSVRMEVINDVIRQSLGDVVKEKQLQPAGTPRIDEITDTVGKNLEFTASFEVYPEINLADFAQISVEKRAAEITDNDVKNMIEKLRDQFANWHAVERNVKTGDKLTVDFARILKEDGATREEQSHVQMIVDDKGVLPGLSEALVGKAKGEQIEAQLRYPTEWADTAAAGKEVTLWVTIHEIEEKETLSIEDLAEKLSIAKDDKDALNATVKERMQEELTAALQDEIKETVLEKLLEANPIELPQALIEQEKEAVNREAARSKREVPAAELEDTAKKRVELGLLLNEVIKKFNLSADGKRVRAQIEKIASRFSKPSEIVEAYYKSNELLYGIERMVLLEQAVDAILAEVKVEDKNVTFDEVMNANDSES
ncbi:trigger factor [Candidatus Berkiella aquae]|uniref:Trigger factor n=1 Tax=Candidatus Berkiella aquae TaxID=295108 RepID=A0A0Q9YU07_9GAMM|nr:trigger factor [Candidatus Berkiella aquae]MCS5711728.1 trigger factor [Candidatus Berkiella aquae]